MACAQLFSVGLAIWRDLLHPRRRFTRIARRFFGR